MSIELNTNDGQVTITNEVIATIAGGTAEECYGIVGMASKSQIRDGIAEILRKENYSKGIIVRQENEKLHIDMYIIEESEKDRNAFKLWQKQIDSKSRQEIYEYYDKLVSRMKTVNKSDKYNYIDLAKKINYLEDKYNIRNNFSYNLK